MNVMEFSFTEIVQAHSDTTNGKADTGLFTGRALGTPGRPSSVAGLRLSSAATGLTQRTQLLSVLASVVHLAHLALGLTQTKH